MDLSACREARENSALVGKSATSRRFNGEELRTGRQIGHTRRLSSEEVRTGRKLASAGDQTRRYRLVVTSVGITASTTPTTATPSMAQAACSQPIQAMNRMEFWAPRIIEK